MTICFFSAQYLPTVGGVERYTYNLAKEAIRAGNRVIVVTSLFEGLLPKETDENGIEIVRLPVIPLMNKRFPVLKPCGLLKSQLDYLWAQNIDFCLINTRFYASSVYASKAAAKRNIPSIVVEHSTGHLEMNQTTLNFLGQQYEHFACRYIYHNCKNFYGVSGAVCEWLKHFGVNAKGTLYNAIDPTGIQGELTAADKSHWREHLGLDPVSKIVVFVGRLIAEKGALELIQAFERADVPNSALVIAGDGPQMQILKASPAPNVFLLGNVNHASVLSLLHEADLYCLPTRYAEGFPTTSLEAAACGCPILTTQTGGSNELIPDESFGTVIPADYSQETLANKLRQLLTQGNPDSKEKIRTHLLNHFTWCEVYKTLTTIMSGELHD